MKNMFISKSKSKKIVSNPVANKNQPTITISGPNTKKQTYIIPKGGIVLGRDTSRCNVVFAPDEKGVSRVHLSVSYNEQTNMFLVEDLHSSYGTYTKKSSRILPGTVEILKNGDSCFLGRMKNKVKVAEKGVG